VAEPQAERSRDSGPCGSRRLTSGLAPGRFTHPAGASAIRGTGSREPPATACRNRPPRASAQARQAVSAASLSFGCPLRTTRSVFGRAPRLAARWAGVGTVGLGAGSLRILRCVQALPRAPTCAVAKSDPRLASLGLTCAFDLVAGLSGPDRGANRAQAEVVSGAPTTGESALTSGYLLVEARSPLPGKPRSVHGMKRDVSRNVY
jgi:hypothetical protein